MLRNHIKIALRFFGKNKLFTTINISGLAIGITAFILLTQYVTFEKNYDQNTEDIYRVTMTNNLGTSGFEQYAAVHPAVGPAMKADFPEVEDYARLVDSKIMGSRGILSYQNPSGELIKASTNDYVIYFAESSILAMFHIPLIEGNVETLNEPQTIILSKNVAHRFFGDENPVGKYITINTDDRIKVTGVFQDLPENTHLKFDMLVSFSSLGANDMNTTWIWPEFYNYVKLKKGIAPHSVDAKLPAFVQKYMGNIMREHGFELKFNLQPVKNIHLKSHLKKEMTANSSEGILFFLMIVAAFVIGIALINFINLSTAKSLERAKEVGLKKVVGAQRNVLISQFLIESLLINLIAMMMAIILVTLLIKPFNRLVELRVLSLSMWGNTGIWMTIFFIFLVGGLLAGIYPAFVLSGFKPIQVLKGKFHHSSKGNLMRKGLVIAQFAIAIALISGTFIVYNQFSFMQNQDLGFKANQNLVVNAPMDVDSTALNKITLLKEALEAKPTINSVTMTADIPGRSIAERTTVRKSEDEKTKGVLSDIMEVDHDFVKTYQIDVLSGRNFVKEDRNNYYNYGDKGDLSLHRVMINNAMAKSLGILNPDDAVNKKIIFKYGPIERTGEIIGVINNYHQESLQNPYNNLLLVYHDFYFADYLTININSHNVKQTINAIETDFNSIFPRNPFTFFFLDDYFNRQYQADLKFGLICLLFSGLAIFIATLGLFGLGSHMAMQKVKEISVRKVLGASTLQALMLIPKKLLVLVLFSGAIAIPIVYLIAHQWLENFAFKTAIDLWMFLLPLLLVMVVAILSILIQSFKSALINPAESLRND